MDADKVCLPASLIAPPTRKTNTQITMTNPNIIKPQLSPWFFGHSAHRFVPCRLKAVAHVWQRRDVLRNPKEVLHVMLWCNEEVAASGWRVTKSGLIPPKQPGANKHSAKTCCLCAGSLSCVGIFHHPNLGFRVFHATRPVQSPPRGQGWQSHEFGLGAVLFKYSLSLQLSMVFQLRLVQVDEPSLGWTHPSGQPTHDVLGTAF